MAKVIFGEEAGKGALERFTFVTVVFEGSKQGMLLQARSMRLYLPRDLVQEIIIVDNCSSLSADAWLGDVVKEYGHLSDLLKILSAREVADVSKAESGWWSQQILKLKIASHVNTPAYLLLDCKHHLVKPLGRDFLRRDGKLQVRAANYDQHPLQHHLTAALDHFGISQDEAKFFPTTTPPFPFDVEAALACVDYAEAHSGSLAGFMVKTNITEFFLYSAFLKSRMQLSELYNLHSMPYPVLWPSDPTERGAVEAVTTSRESDSPFLGVHRNAVKLADSEAVRTISSYWLEKGLVHSMEEGKMIFQNDRSSPYTLLLKRLLGIFRRI